MLIISEDILFKHATTNNEVTETFLIIKWVEFPALIDLIGLITSTDVTISLKLVIIDFRISCDSQP